MLTADHPNAIWLSNLYDGAAEIAGNPSYDEAERAARLEAHHAELFKSISPDLIIHTGGVRLAATGDMAFMKIYGRRRASLSDSFAPLGKAQTLADDHYGIVHFPGRAIRGDTVWERTCMGAWRFEDGVAVEHWELADGPKWDSFYLAGDPDFEPGSAKEFWLKDADL